MSAPYLLSPHVYLCLAGRQVVLLDLVRDKYLAVPHLSGIGGQIAGWPLNRVDTETLDDVETAPICDDDKLIGSMLAKGMLVTNGALGKPASPVTVVMPQTALVEYDLYTHPQPKAEHYWNIAIASTAARWWLKYRPIRKTIEAARVRKLLATHDPLKQIDWVRQLVTSFDHLRPLFYTTKDACLLDSLTLTFFLRRYGLAATWVFGVRTEPFLSHCWVQQGDYVFNDSPHRIKQFSPIMVV
jgi:hypothetical protein